MLGSGNQRSFVMDKLARELQVLLQDNDRLVLRIIAAREKTRALPKTEINLRLCYGVLRKLCLNVIKNMITRLSTRVVDNIGITFTDQAVC